MSSAYARTYSLVWHAAATRCEDTMAHSWLQIRRMRPVRARRNRVYVWEYACVWYVYVRCVCVCVCVSMRV